MDGCDGKGGEEQLHRENAIDFSDEAYAVLPLAVVHVATQNIAFSSLAGTLMLLLLILLLVDIVVVAIQQII